MWPTEANNGADRCAMDMDTEQQIRNGQWQRCAAMRWPGDQCKLKLSAVALGRVSLSLSRSLLRSLVSQLNEID